MDELNSTIQQPTEYNDDDIKTLDWMEHIRRRPGMYIGKLGDGSYADDGIYVLLKEVLDNSIDEYMKGREPCGIMAVVSLWVRSWMCLAR